MDQITSKIYDLGERTSLFSETMLEFCKRLRIDKISQILILQLIRCTTSIGANYMEARNGSSKKDFRNKIFICKKEAQETEYWLRLLQKCFPLEKEEIIKFSNEAHELLLIFQKIISTSKSLELKH